MSKINDAGRKPAFPTKGPFEPGLANSSFAYPGMTLRDWFAGQAMAAIIEADGAQYFHTSEDHARIAYAHADAMLAERSKP